MEQKFETALVAPTAKTFAGIAWAELVECVLAGQVPVTAKSFAELHDHIDANELGGFCDDEVTGRLIAYFIGEEEGDDYPQAYIGFINEVQNDVDLWLSGGLLPAAVEGAVARKNKATAL